MSPLDSASLSYSFPFPPFLPTSGVKLGTRSLNEVLPDRHSLVSNRAPLLKHADTTPQTLWDDVHAGHKAAAADGLVTTSTSTACQGKPKLAINIPPAHDEECFCRRAHRNITPELLRATFHHDIYHSSTSTRYSSRKSQVAPPPSPLSSSSILSAFQQKIRGAARRIRSYDSPTSGGGMVRTPK